MGGVYTNFANVSHSDYEFTVTFARVDHEVEADEVPGVVVSRVNLSPRFMRELIDAMEDNYSKWLTREGIKNLPEYGGGESEQELMRPARAWPAACRTGVRGTPAAAVFYPAEMKVAVVSDIHANRHAFEATLEASRPVRLPSSGASATWSATAPSPTPASSSPRHAAVCLAGNHDMAVCGELPLDEFSRGASLAAQWTREVIAPENLAFLAELAPQGEENGIGLYHASPRDPVWEYVLSALLAELCWIARSSASA